MMRDQISDRLFVWIVYENVNSLAVGEYMKIKKIFQCERDARLYAMGAEDVSKVPVIIQKWEVE